MGLLQGFPRMAPAEPAPTFDLQSHSLHSDGSLPPARPPPRAADAGVTLFALTDHDTVDGVPEAVEAARVKNIELVPAVELSSVHAEHEDLHILGYGLDHTDATLLATLEDFRADRIRRIHAMADNLRELGFAIPPIDHPSPGRPHLAKALPMSTDEAFERATYVGVPGTR